MDPVPPAKYLLRLCFGLYLTVGCDVTGRNVDVAPAQCGAGGTSATGQCAAKQDLNLGKGQTTAGGTDGGGAPLGAGGKGFVPIPGPAGDTSSAGATATDKNAGGASSANFLGATASALGTAVSTATKASVNTAGSNRAITTAIKSATTTDGTLTVDQLPAVSFAATAPKDATGGPPQVQLLLRPVGSRLRLLAAFSHVQKVSAVTYGLGAERYGFDQITIGKDQQVLRFAVPAWVRFNFDGRACSVAFAVGLRPATYSPACGGKSDQAGGQNGP